METVLPLLSICCITFNHERTIVKALESFEAQEVDFPLEIIIYDDFSMDSTREKLIAFKNVSRHQVILLLPPENKFSKGERIFPKTFKKAKGKYIALCEGDDYWIDTLKLQKQVKFLENNSDYVIHSGVAKLSRNNIEVPEFIGIDTKDKTFTIEDFYSQNNLVTCTVMFRNIPGLLIENLRKSVFGDWYIYVKLLHETGLKAYRSTEVLSVYRKNDKGIMMNLSSIANNKNHIDQIIAIKQLLKIKRLLPKDILKLNHYSLSKFSLELEQYKFRSAFNTFLKNVRYSIFNTQIIKYLSIIKHTKIFQKRRS